MNMELEEFKKMVEESLANTSDEELLKYFPPAPIVPTIAEQIAELGRLSGHKYLSPFMMQKRQALIQDLIDADIVYPRFDNTMMNSICTFFDFIDPNKEEYERIYQEAFGKQLLRNPQSENEV